MQEALGQCDRCELILVRIRVYVVTNGMAEFCISVCGRCGWRFSVVRWFVRLVRCTENVVDLELKTQTITAV